MGETSNAEPIKYVEPTLDDRFNVMASAVLSSEYSLDEIDRLAENDPGNVAHEVPDIPKLPFDF